MPFPPVIPITATMTFPPDPPPVIRLFRENTGLFPFQVVNKATRGAVDVTGWTFRMTAKYALANPDAQAAFQLDNMDLGGITIVNGPLGQVLGTLQPIATQEYPDATVELTYDLQGTDTSGVVTTLEFGEMLVYPSATRTI